MARQGVHNSVKRPLCQHISASDVKLTNERETDLWTTFFCLTVCQLTIVNVKFATNLTRKADDFSLF
jgi:hypothetical protein